MSRDKVRREIECLNRIQALDGSMEDLLTFLVAEKFVDAEFMKKARTAEMSKVIQAKLTQLSSEGKFQLLEYEWTILPVERIKILIVTDKASKEISYNFL